MSDNHWVVKKEISYGHILTTLTVAVSLVVWFKDLDKRVSIVEGTTKESKERIEKLSDNIERKFEKIQDALDSIRDRLLKTP